LCRLIQRNLQRFSADQFCGWRGECGLAILQRFNSDWLSSAGNRLQDAV
jgi:hypothetical protein